MKNKKLVILTGATGGMGRAVTKQLLNKFRVIAIGKNPDKLDKLKCPDLTVLGLDLTDKNIIDKIVEHSDISQVYGLVNLAGVSVGAPTATITDEDWQQAFAVNVDAPMRLIRWAGPIMANSGAGSIINVSSPVAIVGARKASYSASKAALNGLTLSAAREYGPSGVRVNQVLPGATITDMTSDWSEEKRQSIAQSSFLKRLCTPDDIANVIQFLLSDASRSMTACTLDLTAGSALGH